MGKIILTENQLTDLIKDVVGKFTDKGKLPDMGIEDILSKATSSYSPLRFFTRISGELFLTGSI